MKIQIPVNHNYYEESPILESALGESFSENKKGVKHLKELFSSVYDLRFGSVQKNNVKIFSFNRGRSFKSDEERLILKLYSKEKNEQEKEYFLQTGLYAGRLFYRGCEINITTKYGDAFLKRMLNFVNDIYVDNEEVRAKKDLIENQFLFIIAYLFLHSLERAAILGLPQRYKKHKERSHKVRGTIDINNLLKRDIPFQGKLTSSFRERGYVQEIVDVLYLALKKLTEIFGKEIQSKHLGLAQLLKQNYSGRFATFETIKKATKHQSINNPMYGGFKRVLEYAEIILTYNDLMPESHNVHLSTTGYLFDIAELYELYLEKLLSKNFPDWIVSGQEEFPIYQQQFYNRSIFPDLVMRHRFNGNVVVFDAKFKKMSMHNGDVDRADLHQIHSYSGYFDNNSLVLSGLLYPLSREINTEKAHADSIYGNGRRKSNFIIDGICVSENQTMQELIKSEDEFVHRISQVLNNTFVEYVSFEAHP